MLNCTTCVHTRVHTCTFMALALFAVSLLVDRTFWSLGPNMKPVDAFTNNRSYVHQDMGACQHNPFEPTCCYNWVYWLLSMCTESLLSFQYQSLRLGYSYQIPHTTQLFSWFYTQIGDQIIKSLTIFTEQNVHMINIFKIVSYLKPILQNGQWQSHVVPFTLC